MDHECALSDDLGVGSIEIVLYCVYSCLDYFDVMFERWVRCCDVLFQQWHPRFATMGAAQNSVTLTLTSLEVGPQLHLGSH